MTKRILVVDDDPLSLDLLDQELTGSGYAVQKATSGEEALRVVESIQPDVILLDYVMPDMDGIEVVRRLRQDERFAAIPVILVTGRGTTEDKTRGLDAGADDYVVKPFDRVELLARVRSMLRIKELHDALESSNRTLQQQVQQQVDELQRMSRLKRYLSPQVAETVMRDDIDALFAGLRREITVVFLDLRGFTEFSDSAEPEEVLDLLRTYHKAMGEIIFQFEGTLERFTGDGIMIFFNAPVQVADHIKRALRMALEMRSRAKELKAAWVKRGYDLGLGIGLASGYATLGEIGFEGRRDYAAVGNVTNLAARLSAVAQVGQILTNQKTLAKVEELVEAEPLEPLELKGFARPVAVFNIVGLKPGAVGKPFGPLSTREQEVAALVASGLSNREIAESLYISERTAESHIQSILNKLGFHSRTQIATWATTQGLQLPKA